MSIPITTARLTGLDPDAARIAALALYAALVTFLLAWTYRGGDWLRAAAWATTGLLLATAWLLPWYLLWPLPARGPVPRPSPPAPAPRADRLPAWCPHPALESAPQEIKQGAQEGQQGRGDGERRYSPSSLALTLPVHGQKSARQAEPQRIEP